MHKRFHQTIYLVVSLVNVFSLLPRSDKNTPHHTTPLIRENTINLIITSTSYHIWLSKKLKSHTIVMTR